MSNYSDQRESCWYDVSSERLAELRERTAQMMQQGPVPATCAHLTIGYVRQHLGAGKERGWWQCTECERKFVPVGTGPA